MLDNKKGRHQSCLLVYSLTNTIYTPAGHRMPLNFYMRTSLWWEKENILFHLYSLYFSIPTAITLLSAWFCCYVKWTAHVISDTDDTREHFCKQIQLWKGIDCNCSLTLSITNSTVSCCWLTDHTVSALSFTACVSLTEWRWSSGWNRPRKRLRCCIRSCKAACRVRRAWRLKNEW